MAADISKLIAKLKREVPEVDGNPILDEIESAAGEGSDAEEAGESPEDEAAEGDDSLDYDDHSPEPGPNSPSHGGSSGGGKMPKKRPYM